MLSSETLAKNIELSRQGDKAAYAEVVRHYQSLVSGITYNMTGDFHKSEDLAQETFLIAWNKLGELSHTSNITGWFCTIARNLAHRSFRKKQETPTETLDEQPSQQPDPANELLRKEQSELIWSAIGEIDEKYRETLILYYRGGESVRAISEVTGVSEESVRQRLVRARKSLKSRLETLICDVLSETAPGETFTLAVLATLPGIAMLSTAAEAATATGVVATATTGPATTGPALGLATLWMVLGPLAYFLGMFSLAWTTTWARVRNAPTLNSRRLRVYNIFWGTMVFFPFIFIFSGTLGVGVSYIPKIAESLGIRLSGSFLHIIIVAFLAGLFPQLFVRRNLFLFKQAVLQDLGLPGHEVKSYSVSDIVHVFHRSIVVNMLMLETLLGFTLVLPATDGSAGPIFIGCTFGFFAFLCLVWFGFYLFGQELIRLCRTKETFLASPPLIDDPFGVALGKTLINPGSIQNMKQAGSMGYVAKFALIALAVGAVWLVSVFVDWNRRPIPTGICVALLVLQVWCYTRIMKWAETIKRKALCNSILFPGSAVLVFLLGVFQSPEGTFAAFCSEAVTGQTGFRSTFLSMCMFLGTIYFLIGLMCFVQYLFRSDDAQRKKNETDFDETRLQEAIARYTPEETGERISDDSMKLSKKWYAVFAAYGIIILAVFWLVAMFPEKILGQTALRMNYVRNNNYTALIALEPNNPIFYYERGCREFDPEKALADFDAAIRLNPNYTEAYIKRAETYKDWEVRKANGFVMAEPGMTPRLKKALADCNKAIELDPTNDKAWTVRADVYVRIGDFDAAIADMNQAIHLKNVSDNYLSRAIVYASKNDYAQAVADCTTAIRLQEEQAAHYGAENAEIYRDFADLAKPIYRLRADFYDKLGEKEKAASDRAKAK